MNATLMDVGAWLLTYAVHSTLLLAAAALLTWRLVRRDEWRDTLWKAALFGGLVTATVQTALDYRPQAGSWDLGITRSSQAPPLPASDAANEAVNSEAAAPVHAEAATAESGQPLPPAQAPAAAATQTGADPLAPPRRLLPVPNRGEALLALWLAVAAVLLGRLAWRQAKLRRMLRQRHEVADGEVLGALAELRRNAGVWMPVRLSASDVAPTPLALGRAEICVPPRFLDEMDRGHQRAALAHELAHLVRRDPLWHFAAAVVHAVFFFQPLNGLARRRIRESAEFLCDEWAARQTGSPLGLARCLAQVASWVAPGRDPIPAGTLAMAEGGSPLLRRVERLAAWRPSAELPAGLRVAAALAVLVPVAAMAPGVTAGREITITRAAILPPAERVQEQVIEHKNPDETLAQRWAWALADARRRGGRVWIAYTFPDVVSEHDTWAIDSGDLPVSGLGSGNLRRLFRTDGGDALLFFEVDARTGAVKRLAGRTGTLGMDFGSAPIYCLGLTRPGESVGHLRTLVERSGDASLREAAVEALAVHHGREVSGLLAGILERDGSAGVRREAATGLAISRGGDALPTLLRAVERDGSADVRREAVEAIARLETPEAQAELRALATLANDPALRRLASESLDTRGGDSFGTLLNVVYQEPVQKTQRGAVESLARYPARRAAPALARIAWTHSDPVIARQAAETLGALPASWAVQALDSIVHHHPQVAVAQQAVESLANYPSGVTGTLLYRISHSHASRRIRSEAADQIAAQAERRGRARTMDHDPNPNPDPDVDIDPDIELDAQTRAKPR